MRPFVFTALALLALPVKADLEVDLDFPGLDSMFVVFRTPTQATGASTPPLVEKTSVAFDGPWRVEFPTASVASRTVDLPRLASWTEQAEPALRYFSGTATYRTTVRLDSASPLAGGIWRLELGAVADMAEVSLNGRSLGVLWRAPFSVDLGSAVRPGENTLEIKVTNTWHNRLVGDEQEPADLEWGPERKFSGKDVGRPFARFPAWLRENAARPSAGRTTFVTWNYFTKDEPLLPAGLLGPVRIVLLSQPKP